MAITLPVAVLTRSGAFITVPDVVILIGFAFFHFWFIHLDTITI
ncbi:hypothetical protein AB6F89_14760 [Providencia hangzhouensis]